MSNAPYTPDAAAAKSNAEFLKQHQSEGTVYIKRHSLQARITHDVTVVCCILLAIGGLFVFVPPLAKLVGPDVVFGIRMSHRVLGIVYCVVPLVSAILAPKGVLHILKNLFAKWDADDKKWFGLFMPYLFLAKRMHMPDQHEVKSGQRFADGMLWVFGLLMAVSGVVLLLGTTVFDLSSGAHAAWLLAHDIGFFVIAVFGMAHIFLGGGLFAPYRGSANLMFGNGCVSESDALYHWGHWAREELADGKNLVRK